MVKDTGSKYFEGAYFVIRSELADNVRESEMITEANNMLGSYTSIPTGIRSKSGNWKKPYIITIAILSAALFAAVAALIFL